MIAKKARKWTLLIYGPGGGNTAVTVTSNKERMAAFELAKKRLDEKSHSLLAKRKWVFALSSTFHDCGVTTDPDAIYP